MCMKQNDFLSYFALSVERIGGAGNKCLKVITSEVSSMLLMNQMTSKWDSCAG